MLVEPGIYYGVSFDDYLSWDAASCSVLKRILSHSALHAKYEMDNPSGKTAFFQGRVLHVLAIEPDKFDERYAILPKIDKRTKAGKEAYKVFQDESNGKILLDHDTWALANLQLDQLKKHNGAATYLAGGQYEVCIIWRDKKTDILCKARIDILHKEQGVLADIKGMQDASPAVFPRLVVKFGYDIQAAFYSDGWKTLTGDDPSFVLLPVEKSPPYAAATYDVRIETILRGRIKYERAIKIFAEAMKTGIWPGYEDYTMLNVPDWALREEGVI